MARRRQNLLLVLTVATIAAMNVLPIGTELPKPGRGAEELYVGRPARGAEEFQVGQCRALLRHRAGRWEHRRQWPRNTSLGAGWLPLFNATLFPEEREWLALAPGVRPSPIVAFGRVAGGMYKSKIGNQQSGCGVSGFQSGLAAWVVPGETAPGARPPAPEPERAVSPSLRLVERLAVARSTLCLLGDSIDYQIYDALGWNLIRQHQLQSHVEITVDSRDIPVDYNNHTGYPDNTGWLTLENIKETTFTLRYAEAGANVTHVAVLRYFLAYGWSPWDASFTDDCDVLVYNPGLHYAARTPDMNGNHWGAPKLADDVRAAVTFLADFAAARKHRVAIWRSTLPQHFNNSDGHWFENHWSPKETWRCRAAPLEAVSGEPLQNYNRRAEAVLDEFCGRRGREGSCEEFRRTCEVNRASLAYRTVYRHLLKHNCTERLARYRGDNNVTGTILHWDVADLFNVPMWHFHDTDCSHFCYVPPLYEAAFERLELLLPALEGP